MLKPARRARGAHLCRHGCAAVAVLAACLAALGCGSTQTVLRTVPPGARLYVNGDAIGYSPMLYQVTDDAWHPPYRYRAELDGYLPAEGELVPTLKGGRVTGAFFTLGILAAFRPMSGFEDDYTIYLQPDPAAAPPPAAEAAKISIEARLAELKRLYDRGAISQEEYRRERARLLGEL